jgi:hypothetical protein
VTATPGVRRRPTATWAMIELAQVERDAARRELQHATNRAEAAESRICDLRVAILAALAAESPITEAELAEAHRPGAATGGGD